METTMVIIFIWKAFMFCKLGQFIYNIGVEKPSISKILTDMFSIVLIISMIFLGFEVLSEIPTWDEFTRFGKYVMLIIGWIIVFGLTTIFNKMIVTPKK